MGTDLHRDGRWRIPAARTAILAFAVLSALPGAAWADLRFCNRGASGIEVTIAYVQKDAPGTTTNGHRGVTLEGWWDVAPNECVKVSSLDVANHWVYYHAHAGSSQWQGSALLCVPSRAHTAGDHFRREGEACPSGERLRGFKRIDGGTRNYTMNLNH